MYKHQQAGVAAAFKRLAGASGMLDNALFLW